jgi:hypothetical protein
MQMDLMKLILSPAMFRSFIKVAIRNLRRNKAFNLVNISGLAIGLASSIFIILYHSDPDTARLITK